MRSAMLRMVFAVWVFAVLSPNGARAQKGDVENDVKNLPKDSGSLAEPSPPAPAPAVPGDARRRLNPAGTYVNRFSGVAFPKVVGDFARQDVVLFDAEGRDTGANYHKNRKGNLVSVISAYSYPVPTSLAAGGVAAVFEDAKRAIVREQPSAKLVQEVPYRAPDGGIGDFAEYEMAVGKAGAVRVRSRLYLFDSKGWLLKIRVTYPLSRAQEGAAEMEAFLRSFGTGALRNPTGA